MRALDDLRVLDLSGLVAGPFCAKLLGDFGADVVKVEPPQGEAGRGLAPLVRRDEGGGMRDGRSTGRTSSSLSAFFLYLNMSKRGVVLDLATDDGAAALRRLVRGADIVVESFAPGTLDRLGLGFAELERLRPGIILTSVTPFGQTGPWRDRPIDELTAGALSGWSSINGRPEREPLTPSGYQASFQAGVAAYIATMAAVVHRDRMGEGQHVDVSILEPSVASFAPGLLTAQYRGEPPRRQAGSFARGPVPAADGHFSLTISRAHFWRDAMVELGLPELAHDERFYETSYRQAHQGEVAPLVESRIAARGKRELFEALGSLRVVGGMVLDADELFDDPHVRARDYFTTVGHPETEPLVYPGAPFRMSLTPWSPSRPAPRLGEHTQEVLAESAVSGHDHAHGSQAGDARRTGGRAETKQPVVPDTGTDGPLAGLRGIVLTQAWAGTFATQLLGLLGMEVIQIEARRRIDSWRGGYGGSVPPALRDNGTAVHSWNTAPLYNAVNLNKRAITLDLSHPEGLDMFKRLVTFADLVAENFSPRVMGNLGLDYESLTRLRPDVILLSMSAYGATGPYANVPGIGGTIEPMAGMSALLGYEGGPPLNSGQMYPDPVAGYYGAAAVLTALHARARSGLGQWIDLSMQEANMTFIGDALMEYSATGRVRGRMGNRHATIAPHGVYRCRDEGIRRDEGGGMRDDAAPTVQPSECWIAISAADDQTFAGLCSVAGHPEWVADPRFADTGARKRHEEALDALIGGWTQGQDGDALERELLAAGVTAARVRGANDVLAMEQLWERGMLTRVRHPEAGEHVQAGGPWRLSRTPGGVTRPSPMLGEHSREVFAELLGMSDEEYERLVALGVTGEGPPD